MTEKNDEVHEFPHPIDNEDLSRILERGWKTGRWVVGVFVLEGRQVVSQVVTSDFPHADFDLCKTAFADNIDKCREYKIVQAPMADMAQQAQEGMTANGLASQFPPSSVLGPRIHSPAAEEQEEAERDAEEEENAEDAENVDVAGVPDLTNLRGKRK